MLPVNTRTIFGEVLAAIQTINTPISTGVASGGVVCAVFGCDGLRRFVHVPSPPTQVCRGEGVGGAAWWVHMGLGAYNSAVTHYLLGERQQAINALTGLPPGPEPEWVKELRSLSRCAHLDEPPEQGWGWGGAAGGGDNRRLRPPPVAIALTPDGAGPPPGGAGDTRQQLAAALAAEQQNQQQAHDRKLAEKRGVMSQRVKRPSDVSNVASPAMSPAAKNSPRAPDPKSAHPGEVVAAMYASLPVPPTAAPTSGQVSRFADGIAEGARCGLEAASTTVVPVGYKPPTDAMTCVSDIRNWVAPTGLTMWGQDYVDVIMHDAALSLAWIQARNIIDQEYFYPLYFYTEQIVEKVVWARFRWYDDGKKPDAFTVHTTRHLALGPKDGNEAEAHALPLTLAAEWTASGDEWAGSSLQLFRNSVGGVEGNPVEAVARYSLQLPADNDGPGSGELCFCALWLPSDRNLASSTATLPPPKCLEPPRRCTPCGAHRVVHTVGAHRVVHTSFASRPPDEPLSVARSGTCAVGPLLE
eukprot:gene25697-27062_t